MIYDLPKIESEQILKAHQNRIYRVERDRLKPRLFIYLNYPVINYHGLNLSDAKKYVFADFIARYERLNGRNVLFSIGYNNTDSSIYKSSNKLGKPIYNFCASEFTAYQKELRLLDISFDEEKEIIFNSEEYTEYVQKLFLYLYEKEVIKLKHGLVVYDDAKVYHAGEYYKEFNKYFSLDGKKLESANRNYYSLSLASIKKDLLKEIVNLKVDKKIIDKLLERILYRNGLDIELQTSNENNIKLRLDNPEYICGISYICLNPNLIDITPFISPSEMSDINEFIDSGSNNLYYTGTFVLNPIINTDIPIFVSTIFDEAIHIGIPSIDEEEEYFVNEYDLGYNPIFDYINEEKILVNSGRFNGLSIREAKEEITNFLKKEHGATEFTDVKLEEIVVSSLIRFGIPIPLRQNQTPAQLPVIYNLKHDVKLENNELADKLLVKEFLNDEFVKHVLTNAIRLKSDAGILDFETITALNEISLFTKANIMVLDEKSYIDDILWHLILNVTLSRYYTKGFDCPIDNILLVSEILDKDNNLMHRDNNNLVSISELIRELGASTVRLYYALNKNDETQSFDKEGLIEMSNLLDKIIKVYYYPIDDTCRDLDNAYFAFVKETSRYAKNYDFQAYFDSIIEFVKKVHDVRHISRAQAKGLLIILSVLTPALAEQIKTDVLNLKEPLYYYSWPEL